jgi:hypothetical protein
VAEALAGKRCCCDVRAEARLGTIFIIAEASILAAEVTKGVATEVAMKPGVATDVAINPGKLLGSRIKTFPSAMAACRASLEATVLTGEREEAMVEVGEVVLVWINKGVLGSANTEPAGSAPMLPLRFRLSPAGKTGMDDTDAVANPLAVVAVDAATVVLYFSKR